MLNIYRLKQRNMRKSRTGEGGGGGRRRRRRGG
jgi:hypothetical protein